MLVDDNPDDNFFHEREIKRNDPGTVVITKEDGREALQYLKSAKDKEYTHPDIIFLDINMPGMNGWDFLREYSRLDKDLQSRVIIIMLTTSETPEDKANANEWNLVSDFITKPLTREKMVDIISRYFD